MCILITAITCYRIKPDGQGVVKDGDRNAQRGPGRREY